MHCPSTLEEVRAIVAGASRVQVAGTGHSFSDVGNAEELVTLGGLPPEAAVDHDARTVTLAAGMTYAELAPALRREGVALHNLASLPHISVGGAVTTATHGSGDANRNLAAAVAGLELVTSAGDVVIVSRGDPGFDGMVVGLGALGAVTRVTLDVEPAYEMRQRVFEGLAWDALFEHFDAITAAAASVSVFTRWGEAVDQVWLKQRVTGGPEEIHAALLGARAADVERHPILGLDPVHCTAQLGVPGPWDERLPHFRAGFTPSVGIELQSEFFVARADAVAAIEAVRGVTDAIRPVLLVSEIRTVAADDLWMSTAYERDSVAIHFTWEPDRPAVERALSAVEPALAPFAPRPHWGKLFLAEADTIAPLYPRMPDFAALTERLDPRGAFRNAWLERVLG